MPASTRSSSPDPTPAELAILQVLWSRGECTVREVWQELGERSGYTTVLKFLQIMRAKGLVLRRDGDAGHVYTAAAPQQRTQEKLIAGLVDRAFAGSTGKLILRALAAKPIAADELKAIKALLNAQKGSK